MIIKPLLLSITFIFVFINSNSHAETYDSSGSVFLFQKQMAKRGNAESQFKLGLMYETGSGVDQSQVLASSWYKKAQRQNYKPASNRLTYLQIKKSGFNDSHIKWLKDLKSDARFNEGEALFLLGQMYSEGTGVNKSLTRSLKLLRKAAGGNIPGADAEIARVEDELKQLQNQFITEDEKTKAVVILPVKKASKAPVKPRVKVSSPVTKKTTPPSIKKTKKTQAKNAKTSKKPLKKQSNVNKKQVTKKHKSVNKTTTPVKNKAVYSKPATIKEEIKKEDEHPMDTICGGRNRFSRACR